MHTKQMGPTFQDEAMSLWMVGKSQSNACNPIFKRLRQQGLLKDEQYWQRLNLAMYKNNGALTRYLGGQLKNTKLKEYLKYWQRMRANPQRELKRLNLKDTLQGREIMRYGIEKLAKTSATRAHRAWTKLQSRYTFSAQDRGAILRAIALGAAKQRHRKTAQWLADVPNTHTDEAINEVRLKLAWQSLDWSTVQEVLFHYPETDRHNSEWQYWLARAIEQKGDRLTALKLFSAASEVRDYYGFLAADRLDTEYNIRHQPIPLTDEEARNLLTKYPAIERVHEFFEVGMHSMARREWGGLLEVMTPREIAMAARIAKSRHWYDRAIITAAKAEAYDDLDVRFPIPHLQEITNYAHKRKLEQAWVYGVIRQESAFMQSVYSHAGAMGLMQLMPSTGRYLARKARLRLSNKRQLMEVDTNLKLGTLYLRELLDTFKGSHILATAGYNAGPGRAQRWHRRRACLPDDVWVELIPFDETRDYVKKVLTYTAIFHTRLDEPVRPLALAMQRPAACKTAQVHKNIGGAD
ncbi:MAG: transglycosylase SLT domain-containing protein [Pseudomonadota bacterium]